MSEHAQGPTGGEAAHAAQRDVSAAGLRLRSKREEARVRGEWRPQRRHAARLSAQVAERHDRVARAVDGLRAR